MLSQSEAIGADFDSTTFSGSDQGALDKGQQLGTVLETV
jgi:hypothetical protein